MSLRQRFLRGAGLAAGGFVLSRLIMFVGYASVTSFVTPAEIGRYTAGTVLTGIALLFAASGMLAAVIAWRGDVAVAASTAFTATLGGGLLLAAVAAVTGPLVGHFFGSRQVGEIASVSGGYLVLRALLVVPEALLQRRMSFARRVVIDPLGAAAFAITAYVACSQGMGPWGLVVGNYVLYTVELVSAWVFARWRPRRREMSFRIWREMAGFARHIVVSELIRNVNERLVTLVLGRFAGAGPLGQYAYGQRVAAQPAAAFTGVASYVLLPVLTRVAHDKQRLRRAFEDCIRTAGFVSIPLSLVLLPAGDQLALLAFGPGWSGAGNVIKAMCVMGIVGPWVSISSETFKAATEPRHVARMHRTGLITLVVLLPTVMLGDELALALAWSASWAMAGSYGLRNGARVVGTTATALLRTLRGQAVAALYSVGVAVAFDALAFGGQHPGRVTAGLEALADGVVLTCVFVLTLHLVSPADAKRLRDFARRFGRRASVPA